MAVNKANIEDTFRYLLSTELDSTKIFNDLKALESAIKTSEDKIVSMRAASASAMATNAQKLNDAQKAAVQQRIKNVQEGLRIEQGALATLNSSYKTYVDQIEKAAGVQRATSQLGIQAINKEIAAVKEYIDITKQLTNAKAATYKVSTGYGSFSGGNSSSSSSTYTPISMGSKNYADKLAQEKALQKELDAVYDRTITSRFNKQMALEEETSKRKTAIRELNAKEEARAYELLNQAKLRQDIKYSTYQDESYKKAMSNLREYYKEQEQLAKRASSKADTIVTASTKGIGTNGQNIAASGAYSSLATGRVTSDRAYSDYVAQTKKAEAELKASADRIAKDQAKAAAEAERAWQKTFMGAIEGGTTFGHKLATTFQYATAGTAFFALASGISAMTSSFLDADKAFHMFRGVLEASEEEARNLQSAVFDIGTTYGGQLKDLNEAALALGRAGIATTELGGALKSVSQLSLVSGESLGVVTDVMVSWATLYPEKKIGDLGDVIVKVANESKASVADFNTMSTYILTAGQQAGLTAEAVASLAGAFKQIGKGSSTSGTEIRRFFQQLESGSDDVRKAYNNLNINMDQLRENLMQGGNIADETMIQLFEKLREIPDKEGQKAIMHIEEVLDKATLKSLLAVAKSGEKGLDEFKRILTKAKEESKGSAEKAAGEVALSYSVAFERIKNTAFQEASVFGQAFTSRLFDGASVGEFDKYIKELTSDTGLLNKTMHNLGVMLGAVIDNIGKLSILLLLFKAGSWLQVGIGTTSAGFMNMARSLGFVNASVATLNALVRANPLLAAGMLGTAIWEASNAVAEYIDGDKRNPEGSATLNAQNAKRIAAEKAKDARALTDELARQETAYKNLSKAANNSSGITAANLRKQAEQAKQNTIDIRKALEYTGGSKTTAPKTPSISGPTAPKANDGQTESAAAKAARDADKLLKQQLDTGISLTEQKQAQYMFDNRITDKLTEQQYSLDNTLGAQYELTRTAMLNAKTSETRVDLEGKLSDISTKILDTARAVTIEEEKRSLVSARRIEDIALESQGLGTISEDKKILLDHEKATVAITRQILDLQSSKGDLTADEVARFEAELLLQDKITAEKQKQLALARQQQDRNYARVTARMLEDYQVLNGFEQYSRDLSRQIVDLEEERLKSIEAATWTREKELLYVERVSILQKRNDTAVYQGMQMQQSMQGTLNSSLTEFFDIQSEGWLDFERLGTSVINNMIKQMIQMSIVNPLATAGSDFLGRFTTSFVSGMFGSTGSTNPAAASNFGVVDGVSYGPSANGNIFSHGMVKAYANGGTFTNSIVRKPTYFASGGGFGVMGEMGPESVMPLKRNSKGQLGVVAMGSESNQPTSIQVSIKNESGENMEVTRSKATTDHQGMVIDIVIDAIRRNKKGLRDVVGGGR